MEDTTGSTQNEEKIQIKHIPIHEEFPIRKNLELSYISINFLKEIAKWTKFISIVGFVLVGFMVLAGLAFGTIVTAMTSMIPSEYGNPETMPAAFGGAFGFIYILMAAFYFFPIYYLYNFSTKLKNAIQLNSEVILEKSLQNLKSHYKFMGIILIVVLVIYGGMFLIFGGIAMMAGSMF